MGFSWDVFTVWRYWDCFRSMASFDSDVLVDMGDFESSSYRSDEGIISKDAKVPSYDVYNCGCWH